MTVFHTSRSLSEIGLFITLILLSGSSLLAQFQDLRKIDPTTIREISQPSIKSTDRVLSVKFSPDGQSLFVGGLDKKVAVYKVSDGNLTWAVEGDAYEPMAAVSVNSASPMLIVAQNAFAGGAIFVFRWATGENLGTLSPYAGGRSGLSFDAATSRLGWAGPDGKVFEFDFAKNAMSTSIGWQHHSEKANSIAYGPFSNLYSCGSEGKVVKGKKEESPEVLLAFDKPALEIAANPYIKGTTGGEVLIAASDNKGKLQVISPKTGKVIFSQTLARYVSALRFHPTDPDVLIATSAGFIYFYNIRTGNVLKQVAVSDQSIWSLDVSIDGKRIAVGLETGEVKIYQMD